MKRRPFSPEELEIISGLALVGMPPTKIVEQLRGQGFDRTKSTVTKCPEYYVNRRRFFENEAAGEPVTPVTAEPVYPKFTHLVTPRSATWTQHMNEPDKVPVSLRALPGSWAP